ncbi:ribosome hibernation-promoting factor, HPF/YfiA family [Mobilicoccus caccae]|uniref:Ribosome hibernation promoting factor n=1 Tax=Mobilicoccus caccae TaxID=1859295 RepID=A0ABQ6IPG6_9MICO|nr:ribosome-associated translation inhibitor RaiA [Mobilicoccus caccae]GMA38986.1 ribosomal subunit interface protein [Mobilicoccus caccae]
MEIVVTGRQLKISDRFREVLEDKLTKVEQLAPRTQRIEVVLTHETGRGTPKGSERLEITCFAKGPVVRAEAFAEDKYSALDLALGKLQERLRRAGDRRKVSRRRGGPDLAEATSGLKIAEMGGPEPTQDLAASDGDPAERIPAEGDSPIGVREKVHKTSPMTLEQAVSSMELVGHDFFLFHDSETDRPSVVYKRRGWDYGVIHLEVDASGGQAAAV